jgi:AcrR family transcriptional regulator
LPSQVRAIRTRAQLLLAAAAEFDEHGFLGTRLVDVAARASVTRGSLYFHFSSKSDIAAALAEQQYARWGEYIPRRRDEGYAGVELLMLFAHDLATGFRDDVESRAAMRLIKEAPQIDAPLPTPFRGWVDLVRDLLADAQRAGEVSPDCAIDDAAWVIVASVFGVQEIGDQLEQRQGICERLDSLWLYILPGLGVSGAADYVHRVAAAA